MFVLRSIHLYLILYNRATTTPKELDHSEIEMKLKLYSIIAGQLVKVVVIFVFNVILFIEPYLTISMYGVIFLGF